MKEVQLTQGQFALVDDSDFDRVSQFKWHAQKCGRLWYARRWLPSYEGREVEHLHNFILKCKWVDHKDGNGLNCQRLNLRRATQQQNQRAFHRKKLGASSKFRGVVWESDRRQWKAAIKVGRVPTNLGRFKSEEDAARAYDIAAVNSFGEFAAPNFP